MSEQLYYLSNELYPADADHFPLDWAAVFGRSAPLAVEIGFGNGEYLADWSRQKPDWNLVGVELSRESALRMLKRFRQQPMPNVRVINDDARFVLRELFADAALAHVVMNFPDPWPKDRHRHRRLIDGQFLETLGAVLNGEGCYELVTDQEWYARDAAELFTAAPGFDAAPVEVDPHRPVTTRYERKWLAMGRHTYRLLVRKRGHRAIDRLLENAAMPHAFVDRPLDETAFRDLIGFEGRGAGWIFVVKAVYRDVDGAGFLLKVVANDHDYHQNALVQVRPHDGNRWIVRLDPALRPHRTPSVKAAVAGIGARLNGA